jgi:hypothetical protein
MHKMSYEEYFEKYPTPELQYENAISMKYCTYESIETGAPGKMA